MEGMEIESNPNSGVKEKAAFFESIIRCTGTGDSDGNARLAAAAGIMQNPDLSEKGSTEFELIEFQSGFSHGAQNALTSQDSVATADESDIFSQSADDYATYLATSQSCTSMLSDQLTERISELQILSDTLSKKEKEIEHLRHVIKELTQARQRVNGVKHELSRRYSMLQDQFDRAVRATQLAQTVSRQNICKTARTRRELMAAEDELARSKKQNASLREKNKKLKSENADLKEKLAVLEKLNFFSDCRHSIVVKELGFSHHIGLY